MKCISINQYHLCIAEIIRKFLRKWLKICVLSWHILILKMVLLIPRRSWKSWSGSSSTTWFIDSSFERPNRLLSILNIWFWFDPCWAVTDVKISLSLPLTSHQSSEFVNEVTLVVLLCSMRLINIAISEKNKSFIRRTWCIRF